MRIFVNDYRGDDTVVNSRNDTLFEHRTRYFLKQQQDFHLWQEHGHEFICFSQHDDDCALFDDVIPAPRNPVARAKNFILDWIEKNRIEDQWIGLWDNDATLYWNRLRSRELPKCLDTVCEKAAEDNIYAWVPFNSQQAPYQPTDCTVWSFRPTLQIKGTMTFIQNPRLYGQQRFNDKITTMDDLVWAIDHTRQDRKVATLEQASLNELVMDKSTIFRVEEYRQQYKKPGPQANPQGLTKWDSTMDRRNKYKQAQGEIYLLYGLRWQEWQDKQRFLWQKPDVFDDLFVQNS